MTTAIPTWLTGALVRVWIARSAAVRPRKSHRSPVRVRSTAASRVRCSGMAPSLDHGGTAAPDIREPRPGPAHADPRVPS